MISQRGLMILRGTFGVDVLSALRHSVAVENGHLELKRLAMLSPAEEVEVLAVSEGATLTTIRCGVMMALQWIWKVRDGRRVQQYHIRRHIRIRWYSWYSLFLVPRFLQRFNHPCCHFSLFFPGLIWGEKKEISYWSYWLTGIHRFCGLWIAWQFLALGLAASAAACAPAPRLKRTFLSEYRHDASSEMSIHSWKFQGHTVYHTNSAWSKGLTGAPWPWEIACWSWSGRVVSCCLSAERLTKHVISSTLQ